MNFGSLLKVFKSDSENTSKTSVPKTVEERDALMFQKFGQKQVLLEWDSAGKLQTSRFNPKFVRLGTIIFLVIAFLLALMQDFVLILVIGSVVFFYYALTKKYSGTPIHCQLINYGIVHGTRTYYWDDLSRFFFSRRGNEELLMVDVKDDLPPRLLITFPEDKRAEIERILKEHILFLEKEPKGRFDKSVESVMDKFNIEDNSFEDTKQL